MKRCTIHKDTFIRTEPREAVSHELAIRKALKAFEPMVPSHVMTALTEVVEGHLKDATHFNVTTYKAKTCEVCGFTWDTSIFGDDCKCLMCHPPVFRPMGIWFGDEP